MQNCILQAVVLFPSHFVSIRKSKIMHSEELLPYVVRDGLKINCSLKIDPLELVNVLLSNNNFKQIK